MKNSIYIAILITTCFFKLSTAQTQLDPSKSGIEESIENNAEVLNETSQSELPDEIQELIQHPLNINTDDLSILIKYNLISEINLQSLREYKLRMGNLIEMQELQLVIGFDKKTIQGILPFCTIKKNNTYSRSNQLTIRYQQSLNKTDDFFPGSASRILLKYRATLSPSIKIYITSEKDPGEEIFTKKRPGFDFNSFSIYYQGTSIIKKIIAGDFNVEFGQGLTSWTGFSFTSASTITGIYKSGRGILPYSGTDENRFMRGLAISLINKKLQTDFWISIHSIDGNRLSDKSSSEETISSLQTSGYHRTYSENFDRHSLKESSYGSAITYTNKSLTVGIVASGQHYNLPIRKSDLPYAYYRFNGKNDFNSGLHYSLSFNNILFFGEGSINLNKSTAILAGLLMPVDQRMSIGILWRSYSDKFKNLRNAAFGINSDNSNEHGIYLGINYKFYRTLTYAFYSDISSFPYLKYRVDNPSYSSDFFHQLDFIPNKKFTVQIRFRNKLKQVNYSNSLFALNEILTTNSKSIRISARFKIDEGWEYSFRTEINWQNNSKLNYDKSTMISQDLFYHPMGKSYSFNWRYAIFNCPDFETRIYTYENDVQGAFSIPFYYGSGSRFYFNLNLKLTKSLSLSMRYAVSFLDNINKAFATKSEIKVQLKVTFM